MAREPMIVKVRKFGGTFVQLLVDVKFGPEAKMSEAFEAVRKMREVGQDFVEEFQRGQIKATVNGPLDNLRNDHLSVHMWLELHLPSGKPRPPVVFDSNTEDLIASFFYMRDLDVVRRSFPRR